MRWNRRSAPWKAAAVAVAMLTWAVVPPAGAAAPAVPAAAAPAAENLGQPITGLTVHEGAYGPGVDGSLYAYAVSGGERPQFGVVDVADNTQVASFPVPGARGGWGITVAPNGDVYLGTYFEGKLFRYRPSTNTFTDLGSPIPAGSGGNRYVYGLSAAPDGTIYGGTYPGARVFAFHPETGAFETITTLATNSNAYVRATAFDPDRNVLYAAVGAVANRMVRIDLETRQTTTVAVDPALTAAMANDLRYIDGRIFLNANGRMGMLDPETLTAIPFVDRETGAQSTTVQAISRGVSEPRDGIVYFSDIDPAGEDQSTESPQQRLMALDLSDNTYAPAPVASGPVHLTRAAIGFGWEDAEGGPVLHTFVGNYMSLGFRYDVRTAAMSEHTYPLPRGPVEVFNVEAGPDGNIYLNSGINGEFAEYDPRTATSTPLPRTNQVERFLWDDGKLYQGMYPDANLQVWDPAHPERVEVLTSLKRDYKQNRPFGLAADDTRIFMGTMPDYGHTRGALTVYDKATGTLSVTYADQTVASVVRVGDLLAVGTSRDIAQGAGPLSPRTARMYLTDPSDPALDAPIYAVPAAMSYTAFTVGPDGLLWGLADGTVFAVDTEKRRVVKTFVLAAETTGARNGRLFFGGNGMLYAGFNSKVFEIDPVDGSRQRLPISMVSPTLGTDGYIYGGSGSHLVRIATAPPVGRELVLPDAVVPVVAGQTAEFDVVVRGTAKQQGHVDLKDVPAGWEAEPVELVTDHAEGITSQTVTLAVSVPEDATGTVKATVRWPGRVATTTTVSLLVVDARAATILADEPAGYWPLGEVAGTDVAIDYSGRNNDGRYVFGARPGAPGRTDAGTAADLTSGYVTVPRPDDFDLDGPFTIEAWVKIPPSSASPGRGIVETYASNADGVAFRLVNGRLQGIVLGAVGTPLTIVNGTTTLRPGTWNHVALVFDGATLTTYVAGVRDGASVPSAAPTAGPTTIKIGARGDDAGQRWGSSLQDVAIYPVALEASTLRAHATAGG